MPQHTSSPVLLLIACAAGSLLGCDDAPPQAAQDTPRTTGSASAAPQTLLGVLQELQRTAGLPAVAGAVITSTACETAVTGVRKVGGKATVEPGDLWHLASNTKAMTATGLGLLVGDGVLAWDTTPAEVWPGLAAQMHSGYRDVTLRDLLTHRAGVPAYTDGADYDDVPDFPGDAAAQRRAFAAYVLQRKPAGRRGTYRYSNATYAIAAALGETASGQSFEDLLRERVLGPLGAEVSFGWPLTHGADQPWGHWPRGRKLLPHDPGDGYELPAYLAPAGDASMDIAGYARFVQSHLRGLRGLAPTGAVPRGAATAKEPGLTARFIKDLHRPVEDYSCGWLEQSFDGMPDSAHEGSTGTFHAITVIVPQLDIAVVVIANAGGDKAARAVRGTVFGLLEEAPAALAAAR